MIHGYLASNFRRQVLRRVGHRGLFLITLGAYDIFFGTYLLSGGFLQFPLELSNNMWGWIWTSIGIALIFGAFVLKDGLFFAAAAFIKTAWALEFLRLAIQVDHRQWARAAYYLALAVVVLIVAAWPEPGRTGLIGAEERATHVRDGKTDVEPLCHTGHIRAHRICRVLLLDAGRPDSGGVRHSCGGRPCL